jgi:hypothetical protein
VNAASYSADEVSLARAIFKPWLDGAKLSADPREYLIAEFRRAGLVGSTAEVGIDGNIHRWTLSRGCILALGSDYKTILWSRTLERMADAALTPFVQLSFL